MIVFISKPINTTVQYHGYLKRVVICALVIVLSNFYNVIP